VDRSGALIRATAPTLIVASSISDELEDQQRSAAELHRGRIVVLENAGHAVFIDQPENFNQALADFLVELD
jgi:pimeloyl-ACP methyl ester carboxylesterase